MVRQRSDSSGKTRLLAKILPYEIVEQPALIQDAPQIVADLGTKRPRKDRQVISARHLPSGGQTSARLQAMIDHLVHLPGYRVVDTDLIDGKGRLLLRVTLAPTDLRSVAEAAFRDGASGSRSLRPRQTAVGACPDASGTCPLAAVHERWQKNGVEAIHVRDLSAFGMPVELRIVQQRFRCSVQGCRRSGSQDLPNVNARLKVTNRLRDRVAAMIMEVPEAVVEREFGLSVSTIRAIKKDRLSSQADEFMLPTCRVLAIDEFYDRGRKRYFTNLVDGERGTYLDYVPGRDADDVAKKLRAIYEEAPFGTITMDMSRSYRAAVRKARIDTTIVADRWHVERKFREQAVGQADDIARGFGPMERQHYKEIKKILQKAVFARTGDEKRMLRDWRTLLPRLRSVVRCMVAFQRFWRSPDRVIAENRLLRVKDLAKGGALGKLEKALATFTAASSTGWRREILNYFPPAAQDGAAEGRNWRRWTNSAAERANRQLRALHRSNKVQGVGWDLRLMMFRTHKPGVDLFRCRDCGRWVHKSLLPKQIVWTVRHAPHAKVGKRARAQVHVPGIFHPLADPNLGARSRANDDHAVAGPEQAIGRQPGEGMDEADMDEGVESFAWTTVAADHECLCPLCCGMEMPDAMIISIRPPSQSKEAERLLS